MLENTLTYKQFDEITSAYIGAFFFKETGNLKVKK